MELCEHCKSYSVDEFCSECGYSPEENEFSIAEYSEVEKQKAKTPTKTIESYQKLLENHFEADIATHAMDLFSRIKPLVRCRGVNLRGVMAVCVNVGSRNLSTPIMWSKKSLSQILDVPDTNRWYRVFYQIVEDNHILFEGINIVNVLEDNDDVLYYACTQLHLNSIDILRVYILFRRLRKHSHFRRRSKHSIYAGSIYIISLKSSLDLLKEAIAEKCIVSRATIRNFTKWLDEFNSQNEVNSIVGLWEDNGFPLHRREYNKATTWIQLFSLYYDDSLFEYIDSPLW